VIDDRVQQWVSDRLLALGYHESIIDQLSPAGLISIIAQHPCEDFDSGVFPIQDYRILLLGREAGAELYGLEDPDNVSRTVNARPELAEALINSYGASLDAKDLQAQRRTVFALYLSGRIGTILTWAREFQREFWGEKAERQIWPAVQGYLVDERNLSFVETALPLLQRGDALLAVGSFHLPGPNGMVTLSRQAGFSVERVFLPGEVP